MGKTIALFFIAYFLILFQTSFLNFLKIQPNLVLIFLLFILIFCKSDNIKLLSTLFSGFFLDIFSNSVLGTNILFFFLIYFLTKIILEYIREINFYPLSFLIILITLFFEIFLPPISFSLSKIFNRPDYLQFNFNYLVILKIIYNLIFGFIGFYILKLYRYKIT